MFPNFTSLAQREQKRQELLERSQRRVQQAKAKRMMYEGASWASDVDKTLSLPDAKVSTSSQTDMSEPLKKSLNNENSQKIPDTSKPNRGINTMDSEVQVQPDITDRGLQARPDNNDKGFQARPDTTDRGLQARPDTNDKGFQARPDTNDKGFQARPETNDKGFQALPDTLSVGSNTDLAIPPDKKRMDTEEQVDSRAWIKKIFTENPNWVALRIEPIRRKNGKNDPRYRLGEKGSLITTIGGNKRYNNEAIDWVATELKIRDIHYDGESNSIDEVGAMRDEESLSKTVSHRSDRKRFRSNVSEGDNTATRKQKFIIFNDKSTSTSSDETSSRYKLKWTIYKNAGLLEAIGMTKSIQPILNGGIVMTDGYVWFDDSSSVSVFGKDSEKLRPAITKHVNWRSTLEGLVEMIKNRGLQVSSFSKDDEERISKEYTQADGEPRNGTKSGIDETNDETLSDADNDAKKILTKYFVLLNAKINEETDAGIIKNERITIPYRMYPIVETQNGDKFHSDYYFGEPLSNKPFNILNDKNKHMRVSGKALSFLMEKIRWMDTFTEFLGGLERFGDGLRGQDYPFSVNYQQASEIKKEMERDKLDLKNLNKNLKILKVAFYDSAHDVIEQSPGEYNDHDNSDNIHILLEDSEKAFQVYGEAQKRYEAAKEAVKGSNSKILRTALKATHAAVRATKAVYQMKAKTYSEARPKLEGRGLMGAGVAPLDGVVRRGRTYNLNEIQGLATPSAYVYRQIGSKYIRLPDLDAKTLVIVQPNRRKCGPKLQISDSLQGMIKTLVYKQQIDQSGYDQLSIDDRKMFREILAITHLQYSFHYKLDDPLDTLRAEYDKLVGELDLGNGNPSIIKQLKSLSVDMYSNRLISDSEFKSIITRLI